jgi:hypothetical protein
MNPSSKDESKSNQETQPFDPPLMHEEPDDDEKEGAEKPAQKEADRERAEAVTKEVLLRVTGGQL